MAHLTPADSPCPPPPARAVEYLSASRRALAASFLPRREDVTGDYWAWLPWRLGQARGCPRRRPGLIAATRPGAGPHNPPRPPHAPQPWSPDSAACLTAQPPTYLPPNRRPLSAPSPLPPQRFCSAVVLNFATQSLLTAVGVGAQKALAASAAINWMLKDGISRVVRMSVATQWGDAFDADLKRFR